MTNRDGRRIRQGDLFGPAERDARILVVDDDAASCNTLLAIMRRAGFVNVQPVSTAREARRAFISAQPDLAVVDLHLPDGDGLNLLKELVSYVDSEDYLPFLVLTGDATGEARDAALAAGAKDFVTKPYDSTEVLLRLHNLLETRVMHQALRRQRNLLVEQFSVRGRELEDARLEILERLARVAEHRDDGAVGHIRRVGQLAGLLASELGCAPEDAEQIRRAAPLHDVGKIGIRDDILLKPGPLAPAEFQAQERHTLIGAEILSGGGFPVLQLAEEIALTHHERWDGMGYPRGLAGEDIPLAGRIVAVADTFDALVHPRPYKPAWPIVEALAEIRCQSGRRFDPSVAEALFRVVAAGRLVIATERSPVFGITLNQPKAKSA
ncbi:MAG: HD domain-containing phosphohydrolase [Longimicrobiales bacterium]